MGGGAGPSARADVPAFAFGNTTSPPADRRRADADDAEAGGSFKRSPGGEGSFTRLEEEEALYAAHHTAMSVHFGGFINTIRLWNYATPLLSFSNLTLLFSAVMTVCAQIMITWLPVYIGRATKELTGGSSGQFADRQALSSDLALAFGCVFMYAAHPR